MHAERGSGRDTEQNPDQQRVDEVFPTDPNFYRQVLDYMPTPLAVVNDHGTFIYVNQALLALGGWTLEVSTDFDFLAYVHPQDRDALAYAFAEIVESPVARKLGGQPWGEISFRVVTSDGSTLPIELVGSGGLQDSAVGGIIYEVRSARNLNLATTSQRRSRRFRRSTLGTA